MVTVFLVHHSVVAVSYFNMDSKEIDFEVYEDSDLIAKIGTVIKQVKAFACTSRGQARSDAGRSPRAAGHRSFCSCSMRRGRRELLC